jgi:glycosyltransferase involved in cell wall biosynthesis
MTEQKDYPKISIVTAVYNNQKYIRNCIESILSQGYPSLEYIIVDGASTDGTLDIIAEYKDQLAVFISEKDKGQTDALNKGFAKATGDIRGWLNADEEYMPGTFLKVGEAFRKDKDLDYYYGNRIVLDDNYQEIGRKTWIAMSPKAHLLYRMHVLPTDASFWSVRAHNLNGELDFENFPCLSMDYDWFLRLAFHIKKWQKTPEFLSRYIERDDRMTQQGVGVDPAILYKNNVFSRTRVIEKYKISKTNLFLGWLWAGIVTRIKTRRFSFPHLIKSFKQVLLIRKD